FVGATPGSGETGQISGLQRVIAKLQKKQKETQTQLDREVAISYASGFTVFNGTNTSLTQFGANLADSALESHIQALKAQVAKRELLIFELSVVVDGLKEQLANVRSREREKNCANAGSAQATAPAQPASASFAWNGSYSRALPVVGKGPGTESVTVSGSGDTFQAQERFQQDTGDGAYGYEQGLQGWGCRMTDASNATCNGNGSWSDKFRAVTYTLSVSVKFYGDTLEYRSTVLEANCDGSRTPGGSGCIASPVAKGSAGSATLKR
ncbi:MAG: hypothetical protein JO101_12270, partial [Candidatus Eremiobacteraeota bacterium]|nr:hypothetical protein [Candidatus Eremiobacteraeota bacterium]